MAATIWKGHLTFGLVSIPIKLVRAARAEKVSFRQLYRTAPATPPPAAETEPEPPPVPERGRGGKAGGRLIPIRPEPEPPPAPAVEHVERVRQAAVTESNTEPLNRREIVKGYEYEKDRYVVLDPEELKSLEPETAREMQILEFVKLADIDPLFFESSYYALPDKGGERPYALLLEALRRSGYVGLAEVAMQRREHIVVVRPGRSGIVMHTMFYQPETHAEDEYRADTTAVSDKELQLATLLIENLAAPFEPSKYRDTYKERLEELIAARLEGRQVAQAPTAPAKQEVGDIMAALQASLAAAAEKKPPVATSEQKRPKTRARKSG